MATATNDKKAAAKAAKAEKAPKSQVARTPDGKIVYHRITITCACGATFEAGSTLDTLRVDICSNCHPFFTGTARVLDAEGRIEKFKKKYSNLKKD